MGAMVERAKPALRLIAATRQLRQVFQIPFLFPDECQQINQIVAVAKAKMDFHEFQSTWEAGSRLTLEQALAEAQLISAAEVF